MNETNILQEIRLRISRGAVKIFRNNNGKLQDKSGRWVTFGLFPGSGDLIGWQTITITPDMVGQRLARFVSIEVKRPKGRATDDQINWRVVVSEAGGIAAEVRSVSEAEAALSCAPTASRDSR